MMAYRFLTGPDDASFCHRVTLEISKGWQLYGQPTLTFDATLQRVICGQVVIKIVEDQEYTPDLDLYAL